MANDSTAFVGCPNVAEIIYVDTDDTRATLSTFDLMADAFIVKPHVLTVADLEPALELPHVGSFPEPGFITTEYDVRVNVEERARPPPVAITASRERMGKNDQLKPKPFQDNKSNLPLPDE